MKCGICGRDRDAKNMVVLKLTDDERAFVKATQGRDVEEFVQCRPCHQVLSDREQGAQLIKGTLQVKLAAAGVMNAEKIAQRMYNMLISKSSPKPVS